MTDWTDYQDDISDAISDSMDMDWSANDGARAVVRWLNENKPLSAAPAPEGGAVDEWRPIDSAPQDGTKIDLWGHWPEHDRWARTPDAVWDEECCDWKVNGFYAGQYAHPPRFTHWRAISGPAALATREEAPAEAGERRVSSESELKRIVKDLITHRRAGDYDLMADDVANCLWPHLRAQPPAREDAQPVANPLVFGSGAMVVNTGKFGGENAVFIAKARKPGVVGEYTWNSAFARDCLQPGELVMTFPTAEQVQAVADALCSTHPAPDALLAAVEAFGVITDLSVNLRQGGPDSSDLNDLSDALNTAVDVAHEALAALQAEQGAK